MCILVTGYKGIYFHTWSWQCSIHWCASRRFLMYIFHEWDCGWGLICEWILKLFIMAERWGWCWCFHLNCSCNSSTGRANDQAWALSFTWACQLFFHFFKFWSCPWCYTYNWCCSIENKRWNCFPWWIPWIPTFQTFQLHREHRFTDGKVITTESSIQFEMVNPDSTGPAAISSYDMLDPS